MAEGFSEFDGHSDQRAVNDEVEVRHFNAVAEVDVRRQRPVADVGGKRIAVELPRVAVDRGNLPENWLLPLRPKPPTSPFMKACWLGVNW
jgi:hypothetical protein